MSEDGDGDGLPIKPVQSWVDSKGHFHPTKEAALFNEIERLLGHVGAGESLAPGIARVLVEKRRQLVPLLNAFEPAESEIGEAVPIVRLIERSAGPKGKAG